VVSLGGLVERSIERAVFDGEVGRREFIRRVGASTAASALASVFPVEVAKAFAQDKVGPIERNAEEAKTLAATVGIDVETAMVTTAMPLRTDFPLTTDPFKYRLMELVGVYGDALRDRCQELFGDGILSAIDCVVKLEKKGERGVLTIDAKFLHYKEY
jgi:cyanate lyase